MGSRWKPMTPTGMLDSLADLLQRSLSDNAKVRHAAEEKLSEFVSYPDYALGLLSLLGSHSDRYENVRPTASVRFKSLLRLRWPKADGDHLPLPEWECSVIKDVILDLLLTASSPIQIHIADALSVTAFDFPSNWNNILPSIVTSLDIALAESDVPRTKSLLLAAASLFSRFRHAVKHFENDVDHSANAFSETLEKAVQFICKLLESNPVLECRPVLECLTLCCKIFYSLNAFRIHAAFKPKLLVWMQIFFSHLKVLEPCPPALEADGCMNLLRAAIFDNMQLFINEEGFMTYLPSLIAAACNVPLERSASPVRAQTAMAIIRFLTTAAAGAHHVFTEEGMIARVYDSVVMPNLRVVDEDKELFNTQWTEYVRLDSKGNLGTHRWAVCELLHALATNHNEEVVKLVSRHVQKLLPSYTTDLGSDWEKDAAMYLVIALRQGYGVTNVAILEDHVDNFFHHVVVPELRATNSQSEPMLKANALRFLEVFRDQIPKSIVLDLFPHVLKFLNHQSSVVHTYAATFVENTWTMAVNPASSCIVDDINLFVPEIIQKMSTALYSYKNPYLMKCLMQILKIATIDYNQVCYITNMLVGLFEEMCNSPENSEFGNYMSEALEAIIIRFCDSVPLERLVPVLERIAKEDILEYVPYGYKLLALLLCTGKLLLKDCDFEMLLNMLLQSAIWHQPQCISSGISLLREILAKLKIEDRVIGQILSKCCHLLSQINSHEAAFLMIGTLMESFGYDIMKHYMGGILSHLFMQLNELRHSRFEDNFANSIHVLIVLFIQRYGVAALDETLRVVRHDESFNIFRRKYLDPVN